MSIRQVKNSIIFTMPNKMLQKRESKCKLLIPVKTFEETYFTNTERKLEIFESLKKPGGRKRIYCMILHFVNIVEIKTKFQNAAV